MMNKLIARYIKDKLAQKSTYILALIIGTLINGYGQFLVPYLRGAKHPVDNFIQELSATPALVLFSIFLGYCFPFLVGIYSAVSARFSLRDFELKSHFPDAKPDPVFCVDYDGSIIYAGDKTLDLFDQHKVQKAQDILGESIWQQILTANDNGKVIDPSTTFFSELTSKRYQICHAPNPENGINIYLSEYSQN